LRTPSPRLEYDATVSSPRSGVPLRSAEATAITNGLVAGEFRAVVDGPPLPADTTTTTPACQTASTA
jgi:hypothetical protein